MTLAVAYLSMSTLENFECYDFLTFDVMNHYDYVISEIPWRSDTDWSSFDYVIVRSSWDYQDDCNEFLRVLTEIDASDAQLLNPLSIIKWNINKTYLKELETAGVRIVPTHWGTKLTREVLSQAFAGFNDDEIIIKPAISANADDTYRIKYESIGDFLSQHSGTFQHRQFLIQPFMKSVIEEGEYSLFYFNGQLSHCILKTPKKDDFRVQEEHGGQLRLIESPEYELLHCGTKCLQTIPETLLYARLDFIRHNDTFLLMEAELIEPSLYFNLDQDSPARFATAFNDYINNHKPI